MSLSTSSKLKVKFDDPDEGWIGVTLTSDNGSVKIVVSYTPNDFFSDLIDALTQIHAYEGDTEVVSYRGPISFCLRFARQDNRVHVSLDRIEPNALSQITRLLEFSGQVSDVVGSFWRALRDLQGRFSEAELTRRWHRPFAWDDIDQLTGRLSGNV
jgi:hypothetical protein